MEDVRVVIPDEQVVLVEFRQDELPCVGALDRALVLFEPKRVFRWHLSIWMVLTDLIDNGMLSIAQRDLIDPFGDRLDAGAQGAGCEQARRIVPWSVDVEAAS
jgi:hypothetical protein